MTENVTINMVTGVHLCTYIGGSEVLNKVALNPGDFNGN